jgi:hypothetical protein
MTQKQFAENAASIIKNHPDAVGLAVGGSWLTDELDEFSDLDLLLVTREKISGDMDKMLGYARLFGNLLTGFTGEHVGESRVLICLYSDPLLHVDIKFLTPEELGNRVETPFILADTDNQLHRSLDTTEAVFPYPRYQWIEDRFWIWIHYALLKIGRGEYFEALDFFGFLRGVVLGPLLHIKNGNLPRGVRKMETAIDKKDLEDLRSTLADYDRASLISALENCISLYRDLRKTIYPTDIVLQTETEKQVLIFLETIRNRN